MEILKKEVSEKFYYIITALVVLSVVIFCYLHAFYTKDNTVKVMFEGVEPTNFEVSKKKPVEEIVFTNKQTEEDKKDILVDRLKTVSKQPLYPSERQAIFAEYGNINKSNLSESEKQELIRALNSN